jgi:hypothetical protein
VDAPPTAQAQSVPGVKEHEDDRQRNVDGVGALDDGIAGGREGGESQRDAEQEAAHARDVQQDTQGRTASFGDEAPTLEGAPTTANGPLGCCPCGDDDRKGELPTIPMFSMLGW